MFLKVQDILIKVTQIQAKPNLRNMYLTVSVRVICFLVTSFLNKNTSVA